MLSATSITPPTTITVTLPAAPPSFTATPPQYVEAKEGGSTLLSCSAQGNPKPIISWLREGEELATNAKYTVRMIAAERAVGDRHCSRRVLISA